MDLHKSNLANAAFIHPQGQNQAAVAQLVQQVVDLLLSEMGAARERSPLPPLTQLPNHTIPTEGIAEPELLNQLNSIIQQSMNAAHPSYIGHMDSIPSTASVLGDFVAGALNNNMLSVEMSPVLSRLEPLLLKEIAAMFGLPETAGGVLVSGGSLGNLQAIAVARNSHFPIREQGLAGLDKPPVFFTSAAAHTSFKKAAMVLGLGSDAAIGITTNEQGKLDCEALEAAIAQAQQSGQAPFAIVATAGTTVTGNIDPIEELAAIAKKHYLWFHVDASYGGALAFSPKHQHLLQGIDQADSITFNPQKWLYVAKTCAMTLFRDAKGWQDNFRIGAPYMGEEDDAINLGEVSLQGTRHGDVLKLWMTLQHLGQAGCAEIIEELKTHDVHLHLSGGETADVGDIVRTIDVGYTTFARLKKEDLIINDIKEGNVIVGISSSGQATYENKYNSGIGSNGLTSARHDTLSKYYADTFPEAYDPNTPAEVIFTGSKRLTDTVEFDGKEYIVGDLLLSPTRTFLPVLAKIFKTFKNQIDGLIHCTGGAQTKVLKFIEGKKIIKNNLFSTPPVFQMIQQESNTDWKEMYQVFNMGHRLEIYTDKDTAQEIIEIVKSFNIDAQIIGHVENSTENMVDLHSPYGNFIYT